MTMAHQTYDYVSFKTEKNNVKPDGPPTLTYKPTDSVHFITLSVVYWIRYRVRENKPAWAVL